MLDKHSIVKTINLLSLAEIDFLEYKKNPVREITFEFSSFKTNSGIIIINVPGANGTIEGYKSKYYKIAKQCQHRDQASYFCMNNITPMGISPAKWMQLKFEFAMELVNSEATSICASANPEIYVVGVSNGGGLVSTVASDYPQIKKVLLIAPSLIMGKEQTAQGARDYQGDLSIVVGENDDIVGVESSQFIYDNASTVKKKMQVLSKCDHQFKGKTNGLIFSKAPGWAFFGDDTFPDPVGGIKLYG